MFVHSSFVQVSLLMSSSLNLIQFVLLMTENVEHDVSQMRLRFAGKYIDETLTEIGSISVSVSDKNGVIVHPMEGVTSSREFQLSRYSSPQNAFVFSGDISIINMTVIFKRDPFSRRMDVVLVSTSIALMNLLAMYTGISSFGLRLTVGVPALWALMTLYDDMKDRLPFTPFLTVSQLM